MLVSLVGGFWIFSSLGGISYGIIYALIWIDKIIFTIFIKIHGYFGIDLIYIPMVLVGIIEGPLGGFIFGFLIMPILTGFLNLIAWQETPPLEVKYPPFLPSPDHLIYGAFSALAGILWSYGIEFFWIVIACVLFKSMLMSMVDVIFRNDYTHILGNISNVAYNAALAYFFKDFFMHLINMSL